MTMHCIYLVAHQQQMLPQQEVLQHVLHDHHMLQREHIKNFPFVYNRCEPHWCCMCVVLYSVVIFLL